MVTPRAVQWAGGWVGFSLVAVVAGCQPAKTAPPAPPPAGVTVARPGSAVVQNYLEYNGNLEAVETVEIRARVKGFLTEVRFKEGDEVREGDRLYTIDPREYAAGVAKSKSDIARAEADMANARAQIRLAQNEFDRLSKVGTAGGISSNELEKAESTLAANKAQFDVATANKSSAEAALRTSELQLSYTDLRAPISGQIGRTLVTRGNLVGQTDSTLLTTIVSTEPIFVYFDVPEKDLLERMRTTPGGDAADASFPIEVGVTGEPGYPHQGILDFRDNRVSPGTGTVRVRGRVPNPKTSPGHTRLLYPGLYARVRVPAGPPQPRPTIPEEALMTGQEGRFVYVVAKDNTVAKRTVTVGPPVWRAAPPGAPAAPGWRLRGGAGADGKPAADQPLRSIVAIEGGLAADDLVIVNGLQKVRPGAAVAPEERQLVSPQP
jgi:multidrug efflux system membrane fusion protein